MGFNKALSIQLSNPDYMWILTTEANDVMSTL